MPTDVRERIHDAVRPTSQPPDTRAILRRAGQRTRRAHAVRLGVLALVVVAAGVAYAVGQDDAPTSVRVPPADGASSPIDFKAAILPVTPSDMSSARQALGLDVSRLNYRAQQDCMTQEGYPNVLVDPSTVQPRASNARYFEDPAFLRANGFGVASNLGNGSATPEASTQTPPAAVLRRCASDSVIPAVVRETERLTSDWMAQVKQLEQSPAMDTVWADWRACMAGRGYDLANDDAVFSLADSEIRQAGGSADSVRAVELPIATAYADCLESGGVMQQRTTLRTAARDAFIAAHQAEYDQVTSELPAAIATLPTR